MVGSFPRRRVAKVCRDVFEVLHQRDDANLGIFIDAFVADNYSNLFERHVTCKVLAVGKLDDGQVLSVHSKCHVGDAGPPHRLFSRNFGTDASVFEVPDDE